MKSFFSGSAIIAVALLISFLLFSAKPSVAETLLTQFQQKPATVTSAEATTLEGVVREPAASPTTSVASKAVTPPPASEGVHYVATAYSLRGRTASGKYVSRGIIAADPRVLPLGSRVRLEAGSWSGDYLVADTGGAIRGRKIDIWTPSSREAMRFGRRKVKLTVLSYPAKRSLAKKRAQI
ncbi:MAG: 3D domain-containing protein [Pyrinomonadaceae bacterium]